MLEEPKTRKYQEAIKIVARLQQKGHKAYLAGGCVRDLLTQEKPKDFDISTSAKPEEIQALFPKTRAVGKAFGVILVVGRDGTFEVATFRGEENYQDGRRPSKVFWVSAQEDAQRRDFTINGLFYDPIKKEIIDFVGGQKDLSKKVIRFIGNPAERIQEDHLRLLRAVRFKNILGFSYTSETEKAVSQYAHLVTSVSKERIKEELDKMLAHPSRAESIRDLSRLGLLREILPEVEQMKGVEQPPHFHAEGDVFEHTLLALKKLPLRVKTEVVWATLLHDVGKPATFQIRDHPTYGPRATFYGHSEIGAEIAQKICQRLRFPKKEREKIVFLVRQHLRHKDIKYMKLSRQRKWAQHPWFLDLLLLWKADGEASHLGEKDKVDLTLYRFAQKLYQEEKQRPEPPKPLVNGYDVMKYCHLAPGPLVGKILKQVEEAQLEEKIKTKKEALKYLKRLGSKEKTS